MAEPETTDLLNDEYWIVTWPGYTLHSSRFPYLVFRMAGGVYAPVKVPGKLKDRLAIWEWALGQVKLYGREACLVMGAEHAIYVRRDGRMEESRVPAMGGTVISWDKWKRGEIREQQWGQPPKTVYLTDNPKSEVPGVSTTNERLVVSGAEPMIRAN